MVKFGLFSVMATMLPIMTKLNMISKSEHLKLLAVTKKKVKNDDDSAIQEQLFFYIMQSPA